MSFHSMRSFALYNAHWQRMQSSGSPQPCCASLVRRWIERYNSKLREKAKKEETRRLKQFVEAAFSLDPRMVRRRAEEKAQKCGALAVSACNNVFVRNDCSVARCLQRPVA